MKPEYLFNKFKLELMWNLCQWNQYTFWLALLTIAKMIIASDGWYWTNNHIVLICFKHFIHINRHVIV